MVRCFQLGWNAMKSSDPSPTRDRCSYIGGSDARTIVGRDEAALLRLWREKRGEVEPEDLSGDLVVQFGCATEDLNRRWFERETGRRLGAVQRFLRHPKLEWMGATLDGLVEEEGAVFEAKFMLPWAFTEESAAEKHMPQLQHNMLVTRTRKAYLSILTGGGKWVSIEVEADPVYQTVLLQVERIGAVCAPVKYPRFLGPSRRRRSSPPCTSSTWVPRMPGRNTRP